MWKERTFQFSWVGLVGVVGILVCLVALGGGASVMLGDATEVGQAVAYGIAAESLIAGTIKGLT